MSSNRLKVLFDKKHLQLLIGNLAIGLLIYASLFTLQLTNTHDGLWYNANAFAGYWEISIGRWLWPILDVSRFGYAADPYNSYLTLLVISAGNLLLFDIFDLTGKKSAYILSALIIANSTVCCFLSFRFMSPTFGFSYLLSLIAVWLLVKDEARMKLSSFVLPVIFLCCSLGLYQAEIGCFALVAVVWTISMIYDGSDKRNIALFLGKFAITTCAACIIYKIVWDLALFIAGIGAASYKGAADISIAAILKHLPERIAYCYAAFKSYYFGDSFRHSVFQIHQFGDIEFTIKQFQFNTSMINSLCRIYGLGLFFVLFAAFIWDLLTKSRLKAWQYVLSAALIISIPVACNLSLLMTDAGSISIWQELPTVLSVPVIVALILRDNAQRSSKVPSYLILVLMCGMLYGNIYQTGYDLNAMYEGRNASDALVGNVVQTLITQDMYDDEKEYLFFGVPADSPMFRVSERAWEQANDYARVGEFMQYNEGMRFSYSGTLRNIGVNLNYGPDEIYDKYCKSDLVAEMPTYPANGSIAEVDGYIFIKIS